MTTRAEATAAPSQVRIAGKRYTLTPIADESWGEFEQWLQDRLMAIAKRNLEDLDLADRASLLAAALDKASRIRFSDPQAAEVMGTYEGAVKITYLSLRPRHPKITEDEVAKMLFNPVDLAIAMDALPLGMPSGNGQAGKKKRAARTGKRKKRKAGRVARKASRRT